MYKIIHTEESVGYFYVEATSREAALDEFYKRANNGEIDFNDMELVSSDDSVEED